MATVDLTTQSFPTTVRENDLVIVDFWAEWCGPCRRFAPIFTKASEQEEYADVVFAKVDTEANPELMSGLGIQAIPTVMAFKGGNLVFNNAGLLNREQLADVLDQLKTFDPQAAQG